MPDAASQASSAGWTYSDYGFCSRGYISDVGGKDVLAVIKLFGQIGGGVILTTLADFVALYDIFTLSLLDSLTNVSVLLPFEQFRCR